MTTTTKVKPPYSKDGRLQLCSRCNRYCSRYRNMCPTCDRLDSRQNTIRDGLRPMFPTLNEDRRGNKHLVGMIGKRGLFIVWNEKQILDRQTYREIAAEAKANGIERSYMIYGRIATYTGPGMDFYQIQG
jgi:hypothetical protein